MYSSDMCINLLMHLRTLAKLMPDFFQTSTVHQHLNV